MGIQFLCGNHSDMFCQSHVQWKCGNTCHPNLLTELLQTGSHARSLCTYPPFGCHISIGLGQPSGGRCQYGRVCCGAAAAHGPCGRRRAARRRAGSQSHADRRAGRSCRVRAGDERARQQQGSDSAGARADRTQCGALTAD